MTETVRCYSEAPTTGQRCQRQQDHLGWHSYTTPFRDSTHMIEWTDDGEVRTTWGQVDR